MAKEKRMGVQTRFGILRTFVAVCIGLIIAFTLILFTSDHPGEAIKYFVAGPLLKSAYFYNVIETMIPLMLTGTAVCVMFSANQFNLGLEGAFYLGGFVAALSGLYVLPNISILSPTVSILLGGLTGALICAIPAFLKYKWGASEMVSSLMLNYICLQIGMYFLNHKFKDISTGSPVTERLTEASRLSPLISGSRIHAGLIIALCFVVLAWMLLYRSRWGYAIRTTGENGLFARYCGISVGFVVMISQIIGGFIGGVGGAVEMLGIYPRFSWTSLTGFGWDGITVAIFARNNPAYVPVAAFFLAYLRKGAYLMSTKVDVQTDIISIVEGVMVLFLLAERFLSGYYRRMVFREADRRRKLVEAAEKGE